MRVVFYDNATKKNYRVQWEAYIFYKEGVFGERKDLV